MEKKKNYVLELRKVAKTVEEDGAGYPSVNFLIECADEIDRLNKIISRFHSALIESNNETEESIKRFYEI